MNNMKKIFQILYNSNFRKWFYLEEKERLNILLPEDTDDEINDILEIKKNKSKSDAPGKRFLLLKIFIFGFLSSLIFIVMLFCEIISENIATQFLFIICGIVIGYMFKILES
jgi:hypothetical protein